MLHRSPTSALEYYQTRFNDFANHHLPRNSAHLGELYAAMHYSFAAGGKRLRPALAYAFADSLGLDAGKIDRLALAIECIHTYSLIHDDLPAMDDDDLRRGQPACHKQFDDATAILAGDALNTLAFELLADTSDGTPNEVRLQQIRLLAVSAGAAGMVGGQDSDLVCENSLQTINLATLTDIHRRKTGALIKAAWLMPYCLLQPTLPAAADDKYQHLSTAADLLGLLYQIQDDILDVTQSSEVLGKPADSDIGNEKSTYVSLLGLVAARRQAEDVSRQMHAELTAFFAPDCYENTPLAALIDSILRRNY